MKKQGKEASETTETQNQTSISDEASDGRGPQEPPSTSRSAQKKKRSLSKKVTKKDNDVNEKSTTVTEIETSSQQDDEGGDTDENVLTDVTADSTAIVPGSPTLPSPTSKPTSQTHTKNTAIPTKQKLDSDNGVTLDTVTKSFGKKVTKTDNDLNKNRTTVTEIETSSHQDDEDGDTDETVLNDVADSTAIVEVPGSPTLPSPTSIPTSLTHTKTTVIQTKIDGANGTEFTTKTVTETETSDHQGITRTITASQKQQERHTTIESLHGSSSEDSSNEAPSLEKSKLKVRQSFTLLSNGEHWRFLRKHDLLLNACHVKCNQAINFKGSSSSFQFQSCMMSQVINNGKQSVTFVCARLEHTQVFT